LGDLPLPKDDRVVVGFKQQDDAAVYRIGKNRLLVQTVDFFTPIVDDPYTFGQISAANSLSDLYAMGATPLFALNIVGFPISKLSKEILKTILKGGSDKAAEAGVPIIGGHSIDDPEPKYGLVVTGEVNEMNLVRNSTAQPGDKLVITKPLGTGILATAMKKGITNDLAYEFVANSMKTLNKYAADLMQEFPINAATDITGFGLLGHLFEMCNASNVSANIHFSELQFFPEVKKLAAKHIIPGGTKRNLNYVSPQVHFSASFTTIKKYLAADPQTSGGLLLSLPPADADNYVKAFNNESSIKATVIGEITTLKDKYIYID